MNGMNGTSREIGCVSSITYSMHRIRILRERKRTWRSWLFSLVSFSAAVRLINLVASLLSGVFRNPNLSPFVVRQLLDVPFEKM